MSLCGAIKSVFTRAGHWIQETYCALGQTVTEQIETASDAIAEKQYLAEHPVSHTKAVVVPDRPIIELVPYRIINGHEHLN